jgi:hypothetical protein
VAGLDRRPKGARVPARESTGAHMHFTQVKLDELAVDTKNPRIRSAKSQKDAMRKILGEQKDKILKLAESVVAQKGMSPIDRFLLLEKKSSETQYITLEGNRRLIALKILDNPDLMDGAPVSKAFKSRIDNLSTKFKRTYVEPIDAAIAKSRKEAKYWINLRHTGANSGAGVVEWHTTQQERFQGPSPQLDILDFVRDFGKLTSYEAGKLEGRFITTLRRLVDSPEVRALMGIEKIGQTVYSHYPAPEIMKVLRRIVLDLALKSVNVTELKKVEQMKAYIGGFPSSDLPNPATKIQPVSLKSFTTADFAVKSGPPPPPPPPPPKPPPKRHGIVPPGTHLVVTAPRIWAIYDELTKLKFTQHSNAIAVLFRVFFEVSIDYFMSKNSMNTKYPNGKFKSLLNKAQEVIDFLVVSGADTKVFVPLKNGLNDPKSPLWIDLLHSYVHNQHSTPTRDNLSAAWDHATPVLGAIWK